MVETVLPTLFEKTHSIDLNCRHGATLTIGEIIHALSKFAKEQHSDVKSVLKEDLLDKTRNLIPHFRERLYFRGLGGELMKQACSDFIEKCSLSSLPFRNEDIVGMYYTLPVDVISEKVQGVYEL